MPDLLNRAFLKLAISWAIEAQTRISKNHSLRQALFRWSILFWDEHKNAHLHHR